MQKSVIAKVVKIFVFVTIGFLWLCWPTNSAVSFSAVMASIIAVLVYVCARAMEA